MAHPQERAWSEGHKAANNDRLRSSCPYNKGMMQQAWLVGWAEGQKSRAAKVPE
jgi:ribosome modulation factor